MMMTPIFQQLIVGQNLSSANMKEIMRSCMQGELSTTELAVFLALMRMKGETVEELSTAARVMLDFSPPLNLGPHLLDIVGTGGDGKNTFNVSTISSIVAAAAGAKIAKHGNRSVSSKSGSADLLLEAGFVLKLSDNQLKACLEKYNVCFLFSPYFHQAMQHAKEARQQLGIRSFFNLLGPLVNPARVERQIVGVFEQKWQEPLLQVLVNLGSERAMLISSQDGMDEVSISAVTDVLEYRQGRFHHWTIDPRAYQCFHADIQAIVVDSPLQSLQLILSVLDATPGPAYDIVLLNAALALYCADICADFTTALEKIDWVLKNGQAKHYFNALKQLTCSLAQSEEKK